MRFERIHLYDLPKLRLFRNDDRVRSWCRQVGLLSEADQLAWFKKQEEDKSMRMFKVLGSGGDFALDEIIAVCGLTSIDHLNARAEFSLYIVPEHQQKGLSKDILVTLFGFGFAELNLNVIWGEMFDGNHAYKVFERIGMVREGTRRQFYFKRGKYLDAHLYSITKDEFNALHSSV